MESVGANPEKVEEKWRTCTVSLFFSHRTNAGHLQRIEAPYACTQASMHGGTFDKRGIDIERIMHLNKHGMSHLWPTTCDMHTLSYLISSSIALPLSRCNFYVGVCVCRFALLFFNLINITLIIRFPSVCDLLLYMHGMHGMLVWCRLWLYCGHADWDRLSRHIICAEPNRLRQPFGTWRFHPVDNYSQPQKHDATVELLALGHPAISPEVKHFSIFSPIFHIFP